MRSDSLVSCIEEGASRVPSEKPALMGVDESLPFGDLLRGARGIAGRLADRGVGPGDRVGIWMEKSPACVQAILGALFCGAAYVPLDPRSPWQRCRTIALDCGLAAVVVDAPRADVLASFLEGQAPRLVVIHGVAGRPAAEATRAYPVELFADAVAGPARPPIHPATDDLAYVLYTSGSTGNPKGVAHTHASGLAFVRWVQRRFAIARDDVFSNHAPLHFDLSISDLFASLGSGASVRLISATEGMLAPYLVRMLDPWGITVWYSVPSVLVSMLEQGDLEERPPARLRLLFFAGEVFPIAQLRRLRRALPRVRLVNLFGPTETNVCTYYELPGDIPDQRTAPVPIGIACEHMETFVIADDGREVTATGVEGTLWAKGGNVMRGYWNDPTHTGQMLRPDPRGFAGIACCTGDRVRLLADGNYEFHGRRDHLVKTRGYRVELGEIEATFAAHPDVREAVAVPLPDPAMGNRIVVSVVPRAGATIDVRALRTYLAGRLPNYMIPAGIDLREELPRTSTGKADRALLRTQWERKGGGDGRVEPRDGRTG